jgi:predicted O-methyltransferase YrrM
MQEQWTAVDAYFTEHLVPADPVLDATLAASDAAGLPDINVAPHEGKLLEVLARLRGARTILELGTLGGYSTIWMGRTLPPDGHMVTLEADPRHAEVARANLARAGLADVVEVRVGPALDTLPKLVADGAGPFDLIFIDADKVGYPEYLTWSLRLSRPGTLIVADNVVRGGAVADPASRDPSVRAVRKFIEMIGADPRLTATAVQTVGSRGYDGFALALVTG